MKTIFRLLGIIAISAVIAVGFVGCLDDDDNTNTTTPVAPSITTASLPNGAINTVYNQTLAASGTRPISWTIESGTLPTGLTLASNGAITGTPTVANTFNFTVKATNSEGNNTKELSIIINGDTASFGETLNLTGQVYTGAMNEDEDADSPFILIPYTGSFTINGFYTRNDYYYDDDYYDNYVLLGGTGSVTSGQLNYTIGTPDPEYLVNISQYYEDMGVDITISDPTVKGVILQGLLDENNNSLSRDSPYLIVYTGTEYTIEVVLYTYVDKDVTYSYPETILPLDEEEDDGIFATLTAATIKLKKGWNALCQKSTVNYSDRTLTASESVSDPSNVYWVYEYDDDSHYSILSSGEVGEIAPRSLFNIPRSIFGK